MDSIDVIRDGYGRVREAVHEITEGVAPAALLYRVDAQANTIAWLLWHLTRVQDHHVSELAGQDQRWVEGGWAARFAMEPDPNLTGYGASPEEVGAFAADSPELLSSYHDDVHAATLRYLQLLSDGALDDVVDDRFDPPVTRGVRLVSVIADDLQHAGQAAYVRGIAERR